MSRPRVVAAVFAACVILLLAAIARLTATVAALDRAESAARWKADSEERIRTALWRMETTVAAFIAQERAVPYFAYTPFYSANSVYSRMIAEPSDDGALVPSPLLTSPSRFVKLYFQFLPDGNLASPQVPGDVQRAALWVSPGQVEQAAQRLSRFAERVGAAEILARLPENGAASLQQQAETPAADEPPQQQFQSAEALEQRQQLANQREFRARSQTYGQIGQRQSKTGPELSSLDVIEGPFYPLWVDELLLLARVVQIGPQRYVQGCWLDWDELAPALRQQTTDLLPSASVAPASGDGDADGGRRLAGLPLRLVVSQTPPATAGLRPDARLSILLTWSGALIAAVAVGGLLLGAVQLSERRAAFVSAVTHELRTPLTTFQLYADMLAGGMVPDEEKQKLYLDTLSTEALRLGHLVENVLAYARLERRGGRSRAERVDVSRLLEWVRPRLEQRAGQAGMTLVVSPEDAAGVCVVADVSAVEQVLFNLVDNACKYAARAEDRRILISAHAPGGRASLRLGDWRVRISVRDFGPGVADLGRKLFQPFHKSAREAAESAPGVGLGLALSRRLARAMGGDLRLANSAGGTCFELLLPRAGD
ncbi:Alkaline phosphatase synthesis sensor protein PhoR [Phycisphaerae bacterium RAS1]|nr:Alkaline phosphatase synthesis sensor protein PhoR [Phycisphaerae bacterium RAS1]